MESNNNYINCMDMNTIYHMVYPTVLVNVFSRPKAIKEASW